MSEHVTLEKRTDGVLIDSENPVSDAHAVSELTTLFGNKCASIAQTLGDIAALYTSVDVPMKREHYGSADAAYGIRSTIEITPKKSNKPGSLMNPDVILYFGPDVGPRMEGSTINGLIHSFCGYHTVLKDGSYDCKPRFQVTSDKEVVTCEYTLVRADCGKSQRKWMSNNAISLMHVEVSKAIVIFARLYSM